MRSTKNKKRRDKKGTRWHVVYHHPDGSNRPYEEQPVEIYFRDDERTLFGVLRFEIRKDNPYRDYEMMVNEIMLNIGIHCLMLKLKMFGIGIGSRRYGAGCLFWDARILKHA